MAKRWRLSSQVDDLAGQVWRQHSRPASTGYEDRPRSTESAMPCRHRWPLQRIARGPRRRRHPRLAMPRFAFRSAGGRRTNLPPSPASRAAIPAAAARACDQHHQQRVLEWCLDGR